VHITHLSTDEAISVELGTRIARARLARNRTQEQLATEAGIGTATLERLEAGRPSNLSTLIRVLRVLDLLDVLDRLVPEGEGPSPIELLALGGRRRASSPRTAAEPRERPPDGPWRWGEEPEAGPRRP
jgi:transcriptional regulator with XRE-family HTH domain